VQVPGHDGRASMAAIIGDPDLAALWAHVATRLPTYARPLFLRLSREIATTATFKHRKNELARDGYDPGMTSDQLCFSDREAHTFVPLDRVLHSQICAGSLRL